jgi:RNA polymerase sigma-70 factor (ECF subfamily)
LFDALRPYLIGDAERGDPARTAEKLHMNEGAVRTAVTRLRAKFRDLLREDIARTVEDPAEVDGEIAYLYSLFAR